MGRGSPIGLFSGHKKSHDSGNGSGNGNGNGGNGNGKKIEGDVRDKDGNGGDGNGKKIEGDVRDKDGNGGNGNGKKIEGDVRDKDSVSAPPSSQGSPAGSPTHNRKGSGGGYQVCII